MGFFGIGGLVMLAIALRIAIVHARLRRSGIRVAGETEVHELDDEGAVSMVVTFRDQNGQSHRVGAHGGYTGWLRHHGAAGRADSARIELDLKFQFWCCLLFSLAGLAVAVIFRAIQGTWW
jgi:hypothetical protein